MFPVTTTSLRNKVPLSFSVLLVFALLALLNSTVFWNAKSSSNSVSHRLDSNKVCFTLIDSRIKEPHFEIAALNSTGQITDFIARELNKPKSEQSIYQYWTLSVLLVKSYALKHGYKVFVSNGKEYTANRTALGQNENWGRLHLLLDLMNDPTVECDWFAYTDSDVYPWLKAHRLSLHDYFSTQRLAPESYNYKTREEHRKVMGRYDPWTLQPESFIVGMNGDFEIPSPWPVEVIGVEDKRDYLCSGIFLVKNNRIGKQLIRDWTYGASDLSPDEKETHRLAGTKQFSWDQRALNYGVFQR
ncbi:hypothetical protein HDU99_004715, partial [Rhizoclosmatium hyalinum]